MSSKCTWLLLFLRLYLTGQLASHGYPQIDILYINETYEPPLLEKPLFLFFNLFPLEFFASLFRHLKLD